VNEDTTKLVPIRIKDKNGNLVEGTLTVREALDNFNKAMNRKPSQAQIKKNKFANNTDYIPIEFLETQLEEIFQEWSWKVQQVQQMANAVVVHGDLILTHPVTGRRIIRSGVGAVPIELRSGSNANDGQNINSKALQKNVPAAEAYAFKNACKKLGARFGRDLNRQNTPEFNGRYSQKVV
jgi:hypothetical protein